MHISKKFNYKTAALIVIALTILTLLGSCSLGYYKQVVTGHLSIIKQRKAIDTLLDENNNILTNEEQRKLRITQRISEFSETQLALPVDNTYSSYVDIQRPYVVWNVFAAQEFSTKAHQWCYPVIGCASYRGYYKKKEAEAYAEKLRKKNLETFVGGVRAYSTLGWFDDPVLNTFLNQQNLDIAALLIHEISHRIAYAKNDTAFNESFATAIELFGVEVWLEQVNSADLNATSTTSLDEKENFYQRREMRKTFVNIVLSARENLDLLYQSEIGKVEKRFQKQQIFDSISRELTALDSKYGLNNYYARWSNNLNNAKIAPVNSYHKWVDSIRHRLEIKLKNAECQISTLASKQCQQALNNFYKEIKELAKLKYQARQKVLEDWQSAYTTAYRTQ